MREVRGHRRAPADPRCRCELLGPSSVWQGAREVGHREFREAEICLQLRHAVGLGAGLPDRILEELDRRREALPEGDLGDEPVRPGAHRRIACRGENLLGKCGRPDDVAGSFVMLGRAKAPHELELGVFRRRPRSGALLELRSELRRSLPTGSFRCFVKPRGQPGIAIARCEIGMQRLLIRVGDPLGEPTMHVGTACRRRPRIHRSGKQRVGKPDPVVGVERHETGGDGRFEIGCVHELRGRARQRGTLEQGVPGRLGQLLDATQDESRHGLGDRTAQVGRLVPVPCRSPGNLEGDDRVPAREGLDAGELVPRKRVSEPLVDQPIEVRHGQRPEAEIDPPRPRCRSLGLRGRGQTERGRRRGDRRAAIRVAEPRTRPREMSVRRATAGRRSR